ncbi:dephospho-CoA kinase [Desulfovibrio inopinatus]|uniref:dephospho-CoA kinase n=1 Tax=Desulfovibrio inopinatus TaxID=102109 RepID=UPI0003FE803E|nr:dephospho-CoA kinase [Desulfovibrio inopinatus]
MDTDLQSERVEERIVPDGTPELRCDIWLASQLEERAITRAKVQDMIKSGLVQVNGHVWRKPSMKIFSGACVRFELPESTCGLIPQRGELCVLYEDDDMIVVNKPPNLTVHPAPSCPHGTLAHRLIERYPGLMDLDSVRPGIVHRLDKDTSGLIAVALNEPARLTLSTAFAERTVSKTYLALVVGRPERENGVINVPLGRDPDIKTRMAVVKKGGRDALTRYRVVWSDPEKRVSLLEVVIETGRTHQIRVHLDHIGHPIVGDAVYGRSKLTAFMSSLGSMARLFPRQMLHAWRLCVPHPTTGEVMEFTAALPKDFARLPLVFARSRQRIVVVGPAGCGKSAFLSCIEKRGWPVFNSDKVVAETYGPDGDGTYLLKQRYGSRFVNADGVDKKTLLSALLEDDNLRREIMHMIHPLVDVRLEDFWRQTQTRRAGFAEIPLFFEIGWHNKDKADVVVGVFCSSAQRAHRLAERQWNARTAATVDSWQWNPEKKRNLCHETIDNDGDLKQLDDDVQNLLSSLRHRRISAVFQLIQHFRSTGYLGVESGIARVMIGE